MSTTDAPDNDSNNNAITTSPFTTTFLQYLRATKLPEIQYTPDQLDVLDAMHAEENERMWAKHNWLDDMYEEMEGTDNA